MNFTADELLAIIDRYDGLVSECAAGRISLRDFLDRYGAFYLEYALDGHESDVEEQQLLRRYAERIALHREITESVLYRLTSEEYLSHPDAAKAGFIGAQDGLRRLKSLAHKYLNLK